MQDVPKVRRVAKLQARFKQAGAHRAVREHRLLVIKQIFQNIHVTIIEFSGNIG